MAFSLIRNTNPVEYRVFRHNGRVFTAGDIVVWERTSDNYDVTTHALGTAIATNLAGVAVNTTTSADSVVTVILLDPTHEWKVDCTNTANDDHNSMRVGLTNAGTINNDGSDGTTTADFFMQTDIAGTKLIGRILSMPQAAA